MKRVALNVEPIQIRRFLSVFQDMVERPEAAAGVVENAIQNDPDACRVSFIEQLAQGFVPAQQRIDLKVIKRMIAVIGSGREDRVQVQGIDTQGFQVVKPIDDPAQITALKTLLLRR
jgi:hypothetical protein